jgi:hypothetical protein
MARRSPVRVIGGRLLQALPVILLATFMVFALLTRISHSVEAHRGANQRKLLCSNDFSLIQGAPRCRQIVAQNALILEWWTVGLWKRPLMAGW